MSTGRLSNHGMSLLTAPMRSSVQSCLIAEESYCSPWDLKIQEEKFKQLKEKHPFTHRTYSIHSSTKPPVLPPLPPGGLVSSCQCNPNTQVEKIELQPRRISLDTSNHSNSRCRLSSLPKNQSNYEPSWESVHFHGKSLPKIPTTRQNCSSPTFRFISAYQDIDDTINLPINRYYWYHHTMSRRQAEQALDSRPSGSFLVRQSESGNANDYSLSIKTIKNCLHMRISFTEGFYILGECSRPFANVPAMIKYFSQTSVPIRGAAHIKLGSPILRWEILSSSLSNEELL